MTICKIAPAGTHPGNPGHFRLSFCVDDDTIINAVPGFRFIMDKSIKGGFQVQGSMFKVDEIVKSPNPVTPAKAGVQKLLK